MNKVHRPTYSEQIALDMEKAIRAGEYLPGHRLPPIRTLAERFAVSRQAINSALLLLQERGLLECHSRIGVFVNKSAVFPKARQIAVLQVASPSWNGDFVSNQLMLGSSLYVNTQFSMHILPHGTTNSVLFDYELERIRDNRPDLLLVAAPWLDRKRMTQLMQLQFPLAFIGDLHDRTLYDLPFNMIRVNTEDRGRYMIRAAAENGAGHAVMVGAPEATYYGKLLSEGARKEAAATGVAFRYYGSLGDDIHDGDQRLAVSAELVNRIVTDGDFDTMVLDYESVQWFLPALRSHGKLPCANLRLITNYDELAPGIIRVSHDRLPMANEAARLLNGLIEQPAKPFGVVTISNLKHFRWVKLEPNT